MDIRFIASGDPQYPSRLREIPHAPHGLYIRGMLGVMSRPTLAIVGTRRATPEGKRIAHEFGRILGAAGCTIVSGLAFGIDAAAHEGALEAGAHAIAVLAGGLHAIYPQSHEKLAEKILSSGGALVSEYNEGEIPHKGRFLERNRIISGLSDGLVVIEVPEKSGALVTAQRAFEQNRDLFVVPGPVTHPNFKASHALIRQGAELVTCAEEILLSYNIAREAILERHIANASPEETLILEALRAASEPLDVDKIIAAAKLEPRIVTQTLTILLLKHLIKETNSGYTI